MIWQMQDEYYEIRKFYIKVVMQKIQNNDITDNVTRYENVYYTWNQYYATH